MTPLVEAVRAQWPRLPIGIITGTPELLAERRQPVDLARLDAERQRRPIQVHPGRVRLYVEDLRETLLKGGARVRQLLHADIERIIVHPVRSATAKPFARAEVITTGKGLLDRVAFVVAGARTHRYRLRSLLKSTSFRGRLPYLSYRPLLHLL